MELNRGEGVWEDSNGGTGLVVCYVKGHIKINTMENTHIQNI